MSRISAFQRVPKSIAQGIQLDPLPGYSVDLNDIGLAY